MGSLLLGTTVYAESYGSVKAGALNARQAPFEFASIASVYKEEDTVKIIDQAMPGWFTVETSPGQINYVSTAYVDVFKVKATINGDGVNSRTLPEENARINRQLYKNDEISVYYTVGDWYYAGIGTEDFFGFIHSDYVDSVEGDLFYLLPEKDASEVEEIENIIISEEVEEETTNESSATSKANTSKSASTGKSNNIVEYAKQFVGNRYVYGGNSLTNGVDCSGFTQQVMKHAGVSLQRSSAAQYANNGVKVSADNVQPGDLMFYGYNGRVSHVGIYIGNGQMVHASSSKTGIIISNAFRTRGKPLIGAKRVL